MDYYQLLGVAYDDPMERIRARYRLLALSAHPDTAPDSKIEEFTKYAEAYRVLGHSKRRQHYNEELGILVKPRHLRPGHDLYQKTVISPEVAEKGTTIELVFLRYEPCSLCWLSGCQRCNQQGMVPQEVKVNVNVPPKTRHGATVLIENKGGQTEPGGERGNLIVYVLFQ